MMLKIYTRIMARSETLLNRLLNKRVGVGKENAARLGERRGEAALKRPKGQLIWIHAASVGEAQSALILVQSLLERMDDLHILVTTGTQTSAKRMEDELPARAFHQFVPLDHPDWVQRFLDHWAPDAAFWMESELWPIMLAGLKERSIPAALINARLSSRSLKRWRLVKNSISTLLSTFDIILAQSENDAQNFKSLGAHNVIHSGNLKYSATPLGCDDVDLKKTQAAIGARPVIVYASTHEGEEIIAAELHSILETTHPNLLTIIIPRHPDRGLEISKSLSQSYEGLLLRGDQKILPDEDARIYIADTLGEMGLFYRVAHIVFIGRSLSADGGGGHNPLEPALLNCAVVHGKNVQNLADIYQDMQSHNACICANNRDELLQKIEWLLSDDAAREAYTKSAFAYANVRGNVIDNVMQSLTPLLEGGKKNAA